MKLIKGTSVGVVFSFKRALIREANVHLCTKASLVKLSFKVSSLRMANKTEKNNFANKTQQVRATCKQIVAKLSEKIIRLKG